MSNPANQIVYVRHGGSDLTGDGSITNPYATVTYAYSQITNNAQNRRYVIDVGAGDFFEPAQPLLLKPWVWLKGQGGSSTRIRGATVVQLDPSWANGGRMGFQNFYIFAIPVVFDMTQFNTGSMYVESFESYFQNTLTINARTNNDIIYFLNSIMFNNVVLNDITGQFNNCYCSSNVTFSSNTVGNTLEVNACTINGNVTISKNGVANTSPILVATRIDGTLDAQTGVTPSIDAATLSLPNNFTGNGVVNLIEDGYGLHYTPANLADWGGVAPTSVSNALDRLAAAFASHGIFGKFKQTKFSGNQKWTDILYHSAPTIPVINQE